LSKSETFTVEWHNSILQHFLARFQRKSKCHSKSKEMYGDNLEVMNNENEEYVDIKKLSGIKL